MHGLHRSLLQSLDGRVTLICKDSCLYVGVIPPPPHTHSSQGDCDLTDPLRLPQRLELEIEPDLYERIEEISIRSGRSIPEIIQELISRSFPMDSAETVFREGIS